MQATPQSNQEPNDLTFDIRGVDPAVANALRRILIAEVVSYRRVPLLESRVYPASLQVYPSSGNLTVRMPSMLSVTLISFLPVVPAL